MKATLTAIVAAGALAVSMAATTPAAAGDCNGGDGYLAGGSVSNCGNTDNSVNNSAAAAAAANASQHQGQGQNQGQHQGQGQSQSNKVKVGTTDVNLNSDVNVTKNDVTVEGDKTEVNAEPAIAPSLAGLTGTSCMGSTTASGAGMGMVSVGFGTTWTDDQCTLRENIKLMTKLDPDVAREMAKDLDGVAEAMARMGRNKAAAPAATVTTAAAPAPIAAISTVDNSDIYNGISDFR